MEESEAGRVFLLPLSDLKLERFPVETSGFDNFAEDPHYPNVKSYLVLGVNLVAGCTGDYDPIGLLMWLPVEQRYGMWDNSHCRIAMLPANVTWEKIAASPSEYIDLGWHGAREIEAGLVETLIPWLAHPYGPKQVYEPQPV